MDVLHGGSGSTYRIVMWNENWTPRAVDIGTGASVNLSTKTKLRTQIFIEKGVTVNNLLFKPKLEKGSKSTAYSKFGQGSVEISTSNKNVLAFKDFEYTEKGITIKCKNNKIHISGTATSAFTIFLTEHCNIKDLNKIIMDKKVTLSSNVPDKCELNLGVSGNEYYMQSREIGRAHV